MKETIMLAGRALEIAHEVNELRKKYVALHDAWEQKLRREYKQLQQEEHEALDEKMTELSKLMDIGKREKVTLDLRYAEEHNVAFLVRGRDEEEDEERNPLERLASALMEQ